MGWIGAATLLLSHRQERLLVSRVMLLASSALLLAYAVIVQVWPFAFACIAMAGWAGYRLRQLYASPDEEHPFAILELGPQDEYLRHTLRIHGQDILRHNPGFVWDGAAPNRSAAVVQHGPETVGILLSHEVEPGVLQLELDYVTKRFRDLEPGRFVFLESGFFEDRGVHRIYTPPNMIGPYYADLGFRPVGDRFVLERVP